MKESLEYVLEEELRLAQVLKRNDHVHDSKIIERICSRVSAAASDYLDFVTEREAQLATGHSVEYLRARFANWEDQGHARRVGRARSYRYLVLDVRINRAKIQDAARKAGRMQNTQ